MGRRRTAARSGLENGQEKNMIREGQCLGWQNRQTIYLFVDNYLLFFFFFFTLF